MMHIVYILISLKDSSKYYIGITHDLENRFKEHNSGKGTYSKKFSPWKIETFITFESKSLTEDFEKYLESGSGHAFLKKRLID